jgi:hypothetical protein
MLRKVLSRAIMLVPFQEVSLVNLDCNFCCFLSLSLLAANEDYRPLKNSFGLRVDTELLGDPIKFDIYSF